MDPWRHERKEKWRELPDSQFRTTNEMFTIKKKTFESPFTLVFNF